MSSSGRSRRSQFDSSSLASSDGFGEDNLSIDVERDEVKRKSRNLSEKKRRDQFNMLINELCSMVNLDPNEDVGSSGNKKMDKSSVLRATITFLKNQNEEAATTNNSNEMSGEENCQTDNSLNHSFISSWKPSFLSTEEFSHLSLEALDAFILVFDADPDGKIIYASESIFPLLGISSSSLSNKSSSSSPTTTATTSCNPAIASLTAIGGNIDGDLHRGTSVYDIIHESEKSALRKLVMEAVNCGKSDEFFSMMIHFRHHSLNLNQIEASAESFYELVRLVGAYRRIDDYMGFGVPKNCFLTICRLQTPKLIKELHILAPLSHDFGATKNNEFISRHSLEWKFLFLDHRAPMIIGYLPFEVLGTSGYDYYHWDDLDLVVAGHQRLMQIGSGESCYYRFLTKGQQWIWLRTKYFITYHMWNSKPEFVVCTHTVIDWDERSVYSVKEDGNRQNNERGKVTHHHPDMNSSRNISSSDFQIKNKPSQWTVSEFIDRENMNEQSIYISDKIAAPYPSNDSNGSVLHSIPTANMMTGVDGCLSLASSSNSSADYILNNPIYDPSPYLMNPPQLSPPNQQQPNVLTDQQKQLSQGHHPHLQEPSLPPPLPQHVPGPQSNSLLSSHQQSPCHQQQQLTEQTHHQQQPLTPPSATLHPQQPQQQSFASSAILPTTGPMVSSSVVSMSQYANMSTGNSQVSYANLQEFLAKKHQLLQKQIKEQQEELRRVSEQLMMVQVVGTDPVSSRTQQQTTSSSGGSGGASGQHEMKSIPEFTQLQTSSLGLNIQSLQPNLTDDTMIRGENSLTDVVAIYTDLTCSDHPMISRDFSTNLQSVDILYPQDKSSIN